MSLSEKIINSAKELKSAYSLASLAMLLALAVVFGVLANTSMIVLSVFENTVKIKFTFIPIAVAGLMYGPVAAAVVGAVADILSFLICPTGVYFPGITVCAVFTGIIFGLVFYKNRISLPRAAAAWFIDAVLVQVFMMAYCLCLLMNGGSLDFYTVHLITRLITEAVKCIPDIALICVVGKIAMKIPFSKKRKI